MKKLFRSGVLPCLITLSLMLAYSCKKQDVSITSGTLVLEFNKQMAAKITNTAEGAEPLMDQFSESEYLVGKKLSGLEYKTRRVNETEEGTQKKFTISGTAEDNGILIEKTIDITVYNDLQNIALMDVRYINRGQKALKVTGWVNNQYDIRPKGDSPSFWSFQGSSSSRRLDWITPVDSGFSKQNYMGMNSTDYGGGIPAIDLWRKDAGIMIGHAELVSRLVSLPVEMDRYNGSATMSIVYNYPEPVEFKPNDTIQTYTTFVSVHQGDFFTAMRRYSELMQKRGIKFQPSTPEAFEPVWCGWGYGRGFTFQDILGTLPKVQEMGIKWVDIDDGFQIAEGDWNVDPVKYPGGNASMKKLIDAIHARGMKAKLWWAPLAVDQGTELIQKDRNILLRRKDNSPQYITYWDSYYMSPTYTGTINHTKEVLDMVINEWGYDGLKMDGQHLNMVDADYSYRRHNAKYPEEAVEKLPAFYSMIKDEVTAVKPEAVLQICPCGCAMNFYVIPYLNQSVASDPTSSAQNRQKCKTYKAINPGLAYYSDHVELTDGGNDFATQVGVGGVPGTKFTWPEVKRTGKPDRNFLSPEKEVVWKKWFDINRMKMLSRETYLGGLYDIGYDIPETHVISKGDTLFYAFYSKEWNGKLEFRGLKEGKYTVRDYVNNVDLGTVSSEKPVIETSFNRNLLVEAFPAR